MNKLQPPSVDDQGRITYQYKGNRTYIPVTSDLIGCEFRVLTDLNISESLNFVSPDKRRYKKLVTRVYSLADRRLAGHSSRFLMSNVTEKVSRTLHEKVRMTRSKTPHAYLVGRLEASLCNSDYLRHNAIVSFLKSSGASFVAYDPYKTDCFRINPESPFLPAAEETQQLEKFSKSSFFKGIAYFMENGIYVLPGHAEEQCHSALNSIQKD